MPALIGRDPSTHRCIQVQVEGELVSSIREVESDTDCWIAPGFVDLQVNGYRGHDLNADGVSVEDVLHLTRALAGAGTTRYLPTIITASREAMLDRLRVITEARSAHAEVRHAVPAIHLEGPYLSSIDGYRGAHPIADIRPPSLDEFEEMQAVADGRIRLVTLSPHWPESERFVQELTRRGIVVSLGHTHASLEQIRAAVDAGATLSTHLGNGMAAQLPRHPNAIWTQLAEDRLTATFIADGVHLSADVLRVMLRAKTVDRAILISDSVALAGAAPGEYHSHIGGAVVVAADGSIRMRDSHLLAGSGISLKEAVARAPGLAACTLADAVRMATNNPAAALGLKTGSIQVGADADLVLFRWKECDSDLEIVDVVVRGVSHNG